MYHDYMTESDDNEELIEWKKFLKGDDRAFVYFYKKYIHVLFSYGMCFTADRELVKDCIQELFVNIYCHRSKLKSTIHVKFYLLRALKNTLINAFCKGQPHDSLDGVSLSYSTDYTIEDKLIEDEQEQLRRESIIHVLELLTPHQKEVIYYRYVEELSMEEIGVIMKMNYQSIRNLLQRALKKLRATCIDKKLSVKINLEKTFHYS